MKLNNSTIPEITERLRISKKVLEATRERICKCLAEIEYFGARTGDSAINSRFKI